MWVLILWAFVCLLFAVLLPCVGVWCGVEYVTRMMHTCAHVFYFLGCVLLNGLGSLLFIIAGHIIFFSHVLRALLKESVGLPTCGFPRSFVYLFSPFSYYPEWDVR